MAELTPDIAPDLVAACQAGAKEAAAALSRALEAEIELAVGEPASYHRDQPPEGLAGPALSVVFTFGESALVAVLPVSSGLVPAWTAAPDASGDSKLITLAQELSTLLMPTSLVADVLRARQVENLLESLMRAEVAEGAVLLPLTLSAGDHTGELTLIWPATRPDQFFDAPAKPSQDSSSAVDSAPEAADRQSVGDFSRLPLYARSLLKIQVPVKVNLATKKQTVQEVIELGPGSIIKFDKSCDQPLELFVGDQQIAEGEVVKVGDKFGLRIETIVMPREQFGPVPTGQVS